MVVSEISLAQDKLGSSRSKRGKTLSRNWRSSRSLRQMINAIFRGAHASKPAFKVWVGRGSTGLTVV